MKIVIEYCVNWNYKPRASSLGDELNKQFGADIELAAGSGGVFEVSLDGKKIFSKRKLNRFPEEREVAGIIGRMAQ